jgi:NAD(P)-dependent dehydrogenase (short-subunit alcohol dehydrogenase family)
MGKDRLKDKVAIVTGAGSIAPGWSNGRATAVLFAREGAKVLAADINPQSAEETAEIIRSEGGECTVCETDVTKSTAIARMVSTCLDAYGRIDILHNNVGIIIPGGAAELSEEDWDFVYNVNLKSIFLTCKHVIPQERGGHHQCVLHLKPALPGHKLYFLSDNQGGHQSVHQDDGSTVWPLGDPVQCHPTRFYPYPNGRKNGYFCDAEEYQS